MMRHGNPKVAMRRATILANRQHRLAKLDRAPGLDKKIKTYNRLIRGYLLQIEIAVVGINETVQDVR